MDVADSIDIRIESDQAEEIELRFFSTGHQGGDAGHGGIAELHFMADGGSHSIVIGTHKPVDLNYQGAAMLVAQGDWEITGLILALVRLGDKLRPYAEDSLKAREEGDGE